MPRRTSVRASTLAFVALVACSNAVEPGISDSSIQVANATNAPIDVWIDGRRWALGLSMNSLSYSFGVTAGSHRVRIGDPVAGMTELIVEAAQWQSQTIVAYPTNVASSGPAIAVLTDTTSLMQNGKSLLRVVNLARSAGSFELRYSQPGSTSTAPILTSSSNNTTSPYVLGDPGVWEVWITRPGTEAKVLSTGPIEIPNIGFRTVLLLDSPGGPRFVVIAT